MDSSICSARTNGHGAGTLEKSDAPSSPRLGAGNRISITPEPSMSFSPTESFGRGITEQPAQSKQGQNQDPPNEPAPDGKPQEKPEPAAQEKEKEHGKPFYKRPVLMTGLAAALIVLAVAGIIFWLHARQYEGTDDAFVQAHVTPISPKVAALIQAVNIDDNNYVHARQLLVQLDPRDFQSALNQARANESAMRGQLAQARSNLLVSNAAVLAAQAEVIVAQVNFENADRNFKRYQALDARATSRQQLDNVTAEERGNQAQVEQARAKLAQAQAQVATAQSQIEVAQGNLDKATADRQQAELNLSYCTITAPQDGYITQKSVEPGSYASVGQVLFSIVPRSVWVIANFKETQIDLMRPGQPVSIHVDAYPDQTFHGKVDSIQAGSGAQFSLLPPENATGNYVKVVQRVPVKIVLDPGETDDPTHILGVGLSVEPSVKVR